MAGKVNVRPECIYASNPFHECTENCSRKMAERKIRKDQKNAGSFRREKKGSRPKPPIPSFGLSEVDSSASYVSPKKKTESRNGVRDLYQLDNGSAAIMLGKQKDSPKTGVSPFSDPGVENKKGEEKLKKLPQDDAIGDEDDGEVESVTSESSVSVGKYRVKASFSTILQSIFDKYGDVATTCKLESQAMRSYYLECVCYVVQELQSTPFEKQSKSIIKQLSAILQDVESSEMNVSWLRGTVADIAEAFELNNQLRLMEEEKLSCDRDIESLQKELEAQMEYLKKKEEEASNAKEGVEETRTRLNQLQQNQNEKRKPK